MKLLAKFDSIWKEASHPFMIYKNQALSFSDVSSQNPIDLSLIRPGDVVALIGDFDPSSILTLLTLIDLGCIVVPLTVDTTQQHDYFFETALVDIIVKEGLVIRRNHHQTHEMIENLRAEKHAGLILFSTGTTGRPKAILHDLTHFLKRFETPRPALRTLNFLLFDHIGGINTLLHTLFNKGIVVAPESRTVDAIFKMCRQHQVEVLPTTPTFLRLALLSGAIPDKIPVCLKIITYGTERMDQPTLDQLCEKLPHIDFRQTFGMSELGIVRVKSESSNSLYMQIGGEGVETKVVDQVLQIRSASRMVGYLNAPSPFDKEGWYNTQDRVEEKNGLYKIVGRTNDVINVGGLKFMASEVERVALEYPHIVLVKATAQQNPITGQHVELTVQTTAANVMTKEDLLTYLKSKLQPHMVPKRIRFEDVDIGHRFKRR